MPSYNEEQFSGSDSDSGFEEDMEALRRACSIVGTVESTDNLRQSLTAAATTSSGGGRYDETACESEDDDLELLRSIQRRFSVSTTEEHPIYMKPSSGVLPLDLLEDEDDYEDDFETLRAIQRRFSHYNDSTNYKTESSLQRIKQVGETNIDLEKESSANFFVDSTNNGQGFPDCVDGRAPNQDLDFCNSVYLETRCSNTNERHEYGGEPVPVTDSAFPRPAQAFVEAIKKNRSCQKFIRSKLIQMEAKIEENAKLRERVKILKDFQVACRIRTGRALSQKKDARIQLISVPKQRANVKVKDNKIHAIYYGPAENSHVASYRDTMSRYPSSLGRGPWSKEEKENLVKGIKQQFQEMLMQNLFSSEEADSNDLDCMIANIRDHEITPGEIRSFLPKVDWENLSSMYVRGRSGAECESRWLNFEDPMINRQPWTKPEDKNLLYILQKRGIHNWIVIAGVLGTNRTPAQCLARYQRSLNPAVIKREWTPDEDEDLRCAVLECGESNWQLVASMLDGRTGPQCSNRWKKSLNPLREKVGKWTPDEDKRLRIAVTLFGAKNWNEIARFVPGRTQVQCRERWVNCLDPSLNMNEWTEEEDSKLKSAIEELGYSWSRIAACIPPRTDSQCRRRWKVLFPDEVPLLQAARKMQKVALISNFVDREEERPALGPDDFVAPLLIESVPESNGVHKSRKNRKPRSMPEHSEHDSLSGGIPKIRSRRARKVSHTDKVSMLTNDEEVENNGKEVGAFDGDNADAPGNERVKEKPRSRKTKPNTSSSVELNNGDNADATCNKRVKKKPISRKTKPKTSSEDAVDINNGKELGAFDGENAIATDNKRVKRKRRSRKTILNTSFVDAVDLNNGDTADINNGKEMGAFDGENANATGNKRVKKKPRSRKTKLNTSFEDAVDLNNGDTEDIHNGKEVIALDGENADATGSKRVKRKPRSRKTKPTTSSDDAVDLNDEDTADIHNGKEVGAFDRENADATGSKRVKRKPRSRKTKPGISSDEAVDLNNGDTADIHNGKEVGAFDGGNADATGNERVKKKPHSGKTKPNTSSEDINNSKEVGAVDRDNTDVAGNGRMKRKPNTLSEDINNSKEVGAVDGDNTDATCNERVKRKPPLRKTKQKISSEEINNGKEVGAVEGDNTDAMCSGRVKKKPCSRKTKLNTLSENMVGLNNGDAADINNGIEVGAFHRDDAEMMKKTTRQRKRKRGGSKEGMEMDEVFEVEISKEKSRKRSMDTSESELVEVPVTSELNEPENAAPLMTVVTEDRTPKCATPDIMDSINLKPWNGREGDDDENENVTIASFLQNIRSIRRVKKRSRKECLED